LQPQNKDRYAKTYISAIQQEKEEQAWFQGADVFSQRTGCDCIQEKKRPQKAERF
jgi:hypothetical protein